MTQPALPFTLTPLPGESFDSWFEAYAARLYASTGELAAAAGLPAGYLRTPIRVLLTRGLPASHLTSLAAAAGLPVPALTAMFHGPGLAAVARPSAARAFRNAWAPAAGTRFCPACLAGNGGRFTLAWRLPWTFYCLSHDQLLASSCPDCGQPPRARMIAVARHPAPGRCGMPLRQRAGPALASCGADLSAVRCPSLASPLRSRSRDAQLFIDTQVARASDSDLDDATRNTAASVLADLSVITFHLATPGTVNGQHKIRAHMLHAAALTSAVALLTGSRPGTDPLTALVQRHASPRASAIPESWRTASPALTARIIRLRDPDLAATERLGRATTLPAPLPPQPSRTDPATTRIHRIPSQIWPAWALRLTGDGTQDLTVFRQAAAVALLLPASNLPLAKLAALTGPHITSDTVKHQLALLARTPGGSTALQAITELGLALDNHHVPINYTRRRELATTTELIDAATWTQLARTHHHLKGSRRRLSFARTYLYELLTAGPPATAPPPYTLPAGRAGTRTAYHDFVLTLPAALASALAGHARRLLAHAGITAEPLQWQPPASWVTTTTWPGADPDHTDPAPLHHALLQHDQPASRIAQAHGLSLEHLRHVIRRHPLPGGTQPPARPGTILPRGPSGTAASHPHAHYIDLTWLHEQYHTWQRTFADIAAQTGCNPTTLAEFARQHGLPARPPGGGRHFIAPHSAPAHPAGIPQPLRSALGGQGARQRIDRFLLIAEHHSISSAARTLGRTRTAIASQLAHLEHRCGGHLFHRHHHRLTHLTTLGSQLRDQAQHYLAEPREQESDNYAGHRAATPPPPPT
jgi:hypothetical protein